MRQPRSVYDARWNAKNPNYAKEKYARNKEAESERHKEYYQENKDRVLARASAYYHSMTIEQRAEHNRKRRERHARQPGVRNSIERVRDHNKRASGRLTKQTWQEILVEFDGGCIYCGDDKNITVEHLIPVVLGGTNDPANLAPACLSCNSSKRAKTYDEYIDWSYSVGRLASI